MERDLDPRAAEAAVREGALLVDVREPDELEQEGFLDDALNLPFSGFAQSAAELPDDRPIVLICRSGSRSAMAADALRVAGRDAASVEGGIQAWEQAGLPVLRKG